MSHMAIIWIFLAGIAIWLIECWVLVVMVGMGIGPALVISWVISAIITTIELINKN